MGQITWYKRYPEDALSGMMGLSLEERGAYNTVLDLIYTRDGKLPDDDRFIAGWLSCDVRVWKRIKDRLIGLGKLFSDGQFLRNSRADEEVLTALSRVGSARDAGKASARSRASKSERKANKNNDSRATVVGTVDETAVSTNQNQSQKPPLPPKGGADCEFEIPDWVPREAWEGFEEMRRKIRKPLTDRARTLAIAKLQELRLAGHDPGAVLDQSTLNDWQGLFEVKQAAPVIPFKRETEDDRIKRERADFLERTYGADSPRAKAQDLAK